MNSLFLRQFEEFSLPKKTERSNLCFKKVFFLTGNIEKWRGTNKWNDLQISEMTFTMKSHCAEKTPNAGLRSHRVSYRMFQSLRGIENTQFNCRHGDWQKHPSQKRPDVLKSRAWKIVHPSIQFTACFEKHWKTVRPTKICLIAEIFVVWIHYYSYYKTCAGFWKILKCSKTNIIGSRLFFFCVNQKLSLTFSFRGNAEEAIIASLNIEFLYHHQKMRKIGNIFSKKKRFLFWKHIG